MRCQPLCLNHLVAVVRLLSILDVSLNWRRDVTAEGLILWNGDSCEGALAIAVNHDRLQVRTLKLKSINIVRLVVILRIHCLNRLTIFPTAYRALAFTFARFFRVLSLIEL